MLIVIRINVDMLKLSIMALSIIALNIVSLCWCSHTECHIFIVIKTILMPVMVSMNIVMLTLPKDTQHVASTLGHYAGYSYAECHIFIVM